MTKKQSMELNRVTMCVDNWRCKDIGNKIVIRTILFNKLTTRTLVWNPNLLIGITNDNDTVAVCDGRYSGNVEIGTNVLVEPDSSWISKDNPTRPDALCYPLNKRGKRLNDLYCSIEVVYYGKISQLVKGQ